jgi:hypothetical protein
MPEDGSFGRKMQTLRYLLDPRKEGNGTVTDQFSTAASRLAKNKMQVGQKNSSGNQEPSYVRYGSTGNWAPRQARCGHGYVINRTQTDPKSISARDRLTILTDFYDEKLATDDSYSSGYRALELTCERPRETPLVMLGSLSRKARLTYHLGPPA